MLERARGICIPAGKLTPLTPLFRMAGQVYYVPGPGQPASLSPLLFWLSSCGDPCLCLKNINIYMS